MSEKMFDCARYIMMIISPHNGRILKVNKEALKSYGYSLEELLNMTIFQLRGLSNDETVKLQMDEASMEGILFESKHYRKDGSCFWVEVSSINIGSNEDLLLSRIKDITQVKEREKQLRENYEELCAVYEELTASEEELKHNYKQMELLKEEAEAANKAKSLFLSNMSHEIRTPLNGIIGMIKLIETTSITTQQREYIDMLSQSSQHLLHVINDILDISKIEAGKLSLTNEPFNLKVNLEKLVKMYALEGYKKDVAVMVYYPRLLEQREKIQKFL